MQIRSGRKKLKQRWTAGALAASLLLLMFAGGNGAFSPSFIVPLYAEELEKEEDYSDPVEEDYEEEDYEEFDEEEDTESGTDLIPSEDADSAEQQKKHTVMIYMVGSNLESRLGSATKDIEEMEAAGLSFRDVNVLVYTGGSRRWVGEVPCNCNCVLDLSKEGEERIVARTDVNVNMGEPQTLSDFINFCTDYYPAEYSELVFWDHGGGPLIGYGSDELFHSDSLVLEELRTAMDQTAFSKESKLALVGFDACLMGSVENMMLWSDYAETFVASEELEPGDGWDYSFLKTLEETDDSKQIARSIADTYIQYYDDRRTDSYDPDVTLSCIDLNRIPELASAINDLAGQMVSGYKKGSYSTIMQKRSAAKNFGLYENYKGYVAYYYDLADLLDLSDQFSDLYPEQAASIRSCMKDAVLYSASNVDRANGITIYFPFRNKSQYVQNKSAYKNLAVSSNYSRFLDLSAVYWMKSKYRNWNLGALQDAGDTYDLTLTGEQLANMTGAFYTIVCESDFGGYVPVVSRCRFEPDEDGVLHLPKDLPLLCVASDGGEKAVCPASEVERDDTRILYRTEGTSLRSDLMYAYHIEDLETQPVSALISLDPDTQELAIRSFTDSSFDSEPGGKNTIDANHWEAFTITQKQSYTTRNENGTILPFREWNDTGSFTWDDLAIDEGFSFELIRSADLGSHLKCQVEIEDINGEYYASELADLPNDPDFREVTLDTEKGVITFDVYNDHAEAVDYTGRDTKLELPEQVEGVPLTVIRKGAFGRLELYSAYGTNPFETVVIPDTVKEIGPGAFLACGRIKDLKLSSSLESIGSLAFASCKALSDIRLPDSLKKIGKGAFCYCSSLTDIHLPDQIGSIGSAAFMGCTSLQTVALDSGNRNYIVKNNALYTADGKILLVYPAAAEGKIGIEEGTETIEYGACNGCSAKRASLPESLQVIGNYAFYGCNNLDAPALPSGLKEIGTHAFDTYTWGLDLNRISTAEQKIRIGSDLSYLGAHAFDSFMNKSFQVDPGNKRFSSSGTTLLNGASDAVISLSINARRQIRIPDGAIEFSFEMLEFLNNLNTLAEDLPMHLYIPESVERFPTSVSAYEIDDMTIHCAAGSPAESFAIKYSIPFSNEMSTAYKTTEIKTEKGVLSARVYADYAMIVGYIGEDSTLTIPDTVMNRPVRVIGNGERAISVNGYDFRTGETLEESAELKRVILPEGAEEISRDALSGFSSLNQVQVELPSTLKRIGETALTYCSIDRVPENIEILGARFINSEPEEDFVLTPSIRYIDPEAFSNCSRFKEFKQNGINDFYSVKNGVLYSADEKTLIHYPRGAGSEAVIEDGTQIIGEKAFYQMSTLKSVSFPSTLTAIGDSAFESCWNLKNVSFAGGKLESIGADAFRFCDEIEKVSFPETEKIGDHAFSGCTSLETVYFQDGLKTIGPDAFSQTLISDPALPDSLAEIGEDAFYNYNGIMGEQAPEQLRIGKNLETIGSRAFANIPALAYTVEEENSSYRSIDGFLTDKDKNTLLACPAGMTGESFVPYGITAIENYAFSNPNGITILHIPDTVEYIGSVNFDQKRIGNDPETGEALYEYALTVYCPKNSYAHIFAMEHEIPFVLEQAG